MLQHFSHVAKVRQTPRWARHVYDPFVIFDASHYLHRFHYERMRYARGLNELTGAQQLLDRYGELWDASKPAAATHRARPVGTFATSASCKPRGVAAHATGSGAAKMFMTAGYLPRRSYANSRYFAQR